VCHTLRKLLRPGNPCLGGPLWWLGAARWRWGVGGGEAWVRAHPDLAGTVFLWRIGPKLTARIPRTQSMTSSTTTTSDEPPTKKQKTMTPALISPTTSPTVPQKAFEQVSLLVQKLSSKGRLPTRGSQMSAGYDLYSYVIFASVLPFWIRFCPVWRVEWG
jgi:hypothetical protein